MYTMEHELAPNILNDIFGQKKKLVINLVVPLGSESIYFLGPKMCESFQRRI